MLDGPLYPRREVYTWGECGKQPLEDLRRWVAGGTFHPYGVRELEREGTIAEALERMREHPAVLKFEGKLGQFSGYDWSLYYSRAGDPDAWGANFPHPTPEDAAYAALTRIEQHEREVYEQELVIGIA